jgi:hypothetical protein
MLQHVYCGNTNCQSQHRIWECCIETTATCKQCLPVALSVKVQRAVIDEICTGLPSNDSCAGQDCSSCIDRATAVPITSMALVEAAQLLQVQQGLICQIGTHTGLNIGAYLSANPTAKVITFEQDDRSYTHLAIQSLQRMFPLADLQLIIGDFVLTAAEYMQLNLNDACNFIYINSDSEYTESLRDLYSAKALADPDWHIVLMHIVSTNSGSGQAWLQAQYDGVIERVIELDDLLLPQNLQRSSPLSVQYAPQSDAADTVTVLTNYTNAAVGRFVHASNSARQRFTRRVRIAASGQHGNITAELYVNHAVDRSST